MLYRDPKDEVNRVFRNVVTIYLSKRCNIAEEVQLHPNFYKTQNLYKMRA